MKPSAPGVFLLLLLPITVRAQATISLKAAARNGSPIPPTNTLTVSPGDEIEAEFLLSGWSDFCDGWSGFLTTYQIAFDGKNSAQSGSCGLILPEGWDAPLERDRCPCNDPRYPICHEFYGCIGPNRDLSQMAFIDPASPDFVFHGLQNFCAVDNSSLTIRLGCANIGDGIRAGRCTGGPRHSQTCHEGKKCPEGICNTSLEYYGGTLNLVVGSDACGTFIMDLDPAQSFILGPNSYSPYCTFTLQPLVLISDLTCSGACCRHGSQSICHDDVCFEDCTGPSDRFGGAGSTCATLDPPCISEPGPAQSRPVHCTIDARVPFPLNFPAQRSGYNQMVLAFPYAPGPAEDAPNDFQVTQIPASAQPSPPTITDVVAGPGVNDMTLNFSVPIQPNKWTCVRHIATNTRRCLGYLPGDAGSNRWVSPSDILDIIDNLNGVRNPTLQIHQCDIDRSGMCTPKDILFEMDLLNGANGFPVQNGDMLPPCPSTTP